MDKEELILLSAFTQVNRDNIKLISDAFDVDDLDDKDNDEFEDEEIESYSDSFDMSKYKAYISVLLNDHTLNGIHDELLDGMFFTSSVDLQDILNTLCRYYILSFQNKPDATFNILIEKDFKFIYKFFKTNKIFAMTLLNNYFLCKIYEIDSLNIKVKDAYKDRYSSDVKIKFITDYMRYKYELAVNELMEKGFEHDDVINLIYLAVNGDDISFLNPDQFEELYFLKKNRTLMLRIIYSDIFEDSVNWDLENEDNIFIIANIGYNINMNKYVLPAGECALDIIDRFTDLVFDPATREYNRNSLDEVGIRILKRVNPVYKTERVMLGYENK